MNPMVNDPRARKDGKCAQCRKNPVPPVGRASGDPFCSATCCRAWYGIEISVTDTERKRQEKQEVTA